MSVNVVDELFDVFTEQETNGDTCDVLVSQNAASKGTELDILRRENKRLRARLRRLEEGPLPSLSSGALFSINYQNLEPADRRRIDEFALSLPRNEEISLEQESEPLPLGSVQYYPGFCIDWLGVRGVDWSTGQSGTIEAFALPIYDRIVSDPLPLMDDDVSESAVNSSVVESVACWNCGELGHRVSDCPKEFDPAVVSAARREYMTAKNAETRYDIRYHEDRSEQYAHFRPGQLSSALLDALGISKFDPPPYLALMHRFGAPPGYMRQKQNENKTDTVDVYDGDARLPPEVPPPPSDSDVSDGMLTVQFPGLNAPIPEGANRLLWEMQKPQLPQWTDAEIQIFVHEQAMKRGGTHKAYVSALRDYHASRLYYLQQNRDSLQEQLMHSSYPTVQSAETMSPATVQPNEDENSTEQMAIHDNDENIRDSDNATSENASPAPQHRILLSDEDFVIKPRPETDVPWYIMGTEVPPGYDQGQRYRSLTRLLTPNAKRRKQQ